MLLDCGRQRDLAVVLAVGRQQSGHHVDVDGTRLFELQVEEPVEDRRCAERAECERDHRDEDRVRRHQHLFGVTGQVDFPQDGRGAGRPLPAQSTFDVVLQPYTGGCVLVHKEHLVDLPIQGAPIVPRRQFDEHIGDQATRDDLGGFERPAGRRGDD